MLIFLLYILLFRKVCVKEKMVYIGTSLRATFAGKVIENFIEMFLIICTALTRGDYLEKDAVRLLEKLLKTSQKTYGASARGLFRKKGGTFADKIIKNFTEMLLIFFCWSV